jgi:hypothetical protein
MKKVILILLFPACISSKKVEDNKRQQQIQTWFSELDKQPTVTPENFDSLNKIYHYQTAVINNGINLKTYFWIQDSIANKNGWFRPVYDSVNNTIEFLY